MVKWQLIKKQLVEDDTQRPRVYLTIELLSSLEELRGHVRQGATGVLAGYDLTEQVMTKAKVCQAKSRDPHLYVVVHEDVVKFVVAVDDTFVLAVLSTADDHLEDLSYIVLAHLGPGPTRLEVVSERRHHQWQNDHQVVWAFEPVNDA